MLDPNLTSQKEFQIIKSASFFHGVFFDPSTGPITAGCPAATLNPSGTGGVREIDDSATEDIFPENELDAHYVQLGWPSPSGLPGRPRETMTPRAQRIRGTET
ncbi:unnamed protein product [Rhizoctonia solani]|uniref:Uncharacterized protein n=1 Tax=Rhizoctonia solani TaxID=456999 RepID=A0A8H3CRG8_9AGAM|nr:unnamed protein product [Rhizoctonia solani]